MRTHDFWRLDSFLDVALKMRMLSERSAALVAFTVYFSR